VGRIIKAREISGKKRREGKDWLKIVASFPKLTVQREGPGSLVAKQESDGKGEDEDENSEEEKGEEPYEGSKKK